MVCKMKIKEYLLNLCIVFDQLVNTFAGGRPDSTVSACAFAYGGKDDFWYVVKRIIDFAFYPIHGKDHCLQAFSRDNEEYNEGGWLRKSLIAFVTIPFCIVLSLITWPYEYLKRMF